MTTRILFFSNLYPLPWEPTRAQYNYQQTSFLENDAEISYLIPVAFVTWFKEVLFKGQHSKKNNVCYFPYFYLPGFAHFLHPFFMLFSIIVCIKPLLWFARHNNVLASWAFQEGVAAAILKKIFKFKLTIDCLGSDVNVHGADPKRKKLLSWAFSKADTVATKSKALAKKVHALAPKANAITIYNGVDFDKFTPAPKTRTAKIKLLFIGNLIKTKGVFELLDAASQLQREDFQFELNILGKGPEIQNLSSLIEERNLKEQVKLIGSVAHSELNGWLKNTDALVLPSYREGVPNVIMESLATGTPVIATAVGGIPEVVIEGVNGVLLENYHSETIKIAIENFAKSNWNSGKISDSVSSFTWQATSKGFLETF